MAVHHTTVSVAISITAFAVVTLLSIPALYQIITRFRARKAQYQHLSGIYEDKDGVATEESQEAFSDFIPRLILILLSIVVCLDALASAVIITTRPDLPLTIEQWLQFGTWVS